MHIATYLTYMYYVYTTTKYTTLTLTGQLYHAPAPNELPHDWNASKSTRHSTPAFGGS